MYELSIYGVLCEVIKTLGQARSYLGLTLDPTLGPTLVPTLGPTLTAWLWDSKVQNRVIST